MSSGHPQQPSLQLFQSFCQESLDATEVVHPQPERSRPTAGVCQALVRGDPVPAPWHFGSSGGETWSKQGSWGFPVEISSIFGRSTCFFVLWETWETTTVPYVDLVAGLRTLRNGHGINAQAVMSQVHELDADGEDCGDHGHCCHGGVSGAHDWVDWVLYGSIRFDSNWEVNFWLYPWFTQVPRIQLCTATVIPGPVFGFLKTDVLGTCSAYIIFCFDLPCVRYWYLQFTGRAPNISWSITPSI